MRARPRARLAPFAAAQILPLVGSLVVGGSVAMALALFFVLRPLLPPRGLQVCLCSMGSPPKVRVGDSARVRDYEQLRGCRIARAQLGGMRGGLSQRDGCESSSLTHSRTSIISFFFSASPAAGAGSERAAVLATCIHDTVCIAYNAEHVVHFSQLREEEAIPYASDPLNPP